VAFELTAFRTRVARRILGLFVLCAVVPIVTLAVVSYRRVRGQLTEQTGLWLGQLSKETGITLLKRLTQIDEVARAAGHELAEGRTPPLPALDQPPDAEPLLWITGVSLVEPAGAVHPVYGRPPSPPPLGSEDAAALRAGRPVLLTESPQRFWLARALGNPSAVSATLWTAIDATALLGIDQSSEVLPVGAGLCILDAQRRPLYCPAGVPPPLLRPAPEHVSRRSVVTWRQAGADYLAVPWDLFLRSHFAAPPLTIAVSEPAAAVLASLTGFRRTFPLVVGLTVLFALALGYTLIRRSTEPLAQLQEGTRRIAALDFSQPVRVQSGDEFETLADSFNAMAGRVQQARTSLQESETRLRTIMDTAPLGVLTLDAQGTVEYVNGTAQRQFARPPESIVGHPAAGLVADPAEAGRFLEPGESAELTAQRGDGTTFPIELSVSEVRLGGRTLFTVLVRDLSERKQAEEVRERLEGQLRQAQKLETIGTLAGGIAHDFNNILTAVLGYVELALAELPADHPVHDDLLEVQRAGLRATDLARQILVFSRRTEQTRRLVILEEVVDEALKLLRATLPSTIEIRRSVDPETPLVEADPTQIHQVLMNLCTNAGHAMREGGTLELVLAAVEIAPGQADAPMTLAPGSYARLSVRDTGHGMDRDTLERIFDPFFTTKAAGEGTGLGLSVVHGIVTGLGGAIGVDSAPAAGTTFTVYLPATAGGVRAEEETPASALVGNERVLVVDDDAAVAAVTKRLLDRAGYRVTACTSSVEALELIRTEPGGFDLVLTDQTMPNLTGLELAAAVHRLRPALPIILTSGLAEAPDAPTRHAMGIDALLTKPADPRELAAVVRRALDRHREGGPA
jgi:PAS domain S-box-containing protein